MLCPTFTHKLTQTVGTTEALGDTRSPSCCRRAVLTPASFIKNAGVAGRRAGGGGAGLRCFVLPRQLRGIQYFKEMMSEVPIWRLEIGEKVDTVWLKSQECFGLI